VSGPGLIMKRRAYWAILVLLASCTTTSLRDVPQFTDTVIKAHDLARIPDHRVKLDIVDHRPDEMLSNSEGLRVTLQSQVSLMLEKSGIETNGIGPSTLTLTVNPYYDDHKVFQDHCVELDAKLHILHEGDPKPDPKRVGARHRPVDIHV